MAGSASDVSVDLLEAVPTYLMVTWAAKYGTLFLVLCFLTYVLIEQGRALRIHLAQYGLLGLSVALFPLLLPVVAEPLGFTVAYAISTAAVMAQASLYTLSVTGRVRPALLFAGVLGTLFVVLRLQTYALLTGTVVLFLVLSVIMATTRRLDWSGRAGRHE
ncbi:MAG: inner membrane CreD family protein [Janthinobacterium lividum]